MECQIWFGHCLIFQNYSHKRHWTGYWILALYKCIIIIYYYSGTQEAFTAFQRLIDYYFNKNFNKQTFTLTYTNCKNDLLPPALNYLYTSNSNVHYYTTRQRHLLHVNKSTIKTYSNSSGNASTRIWNVLQSKIEVHISLYKFKISLKLYLQES